MENTLANKAKFFAQYWGQNVLTRPHCGGKKWILGDEVSIQSALSKHGYDYQYFLELKPLSSIPDEDLIDLYNVAYPRSTVSEEKIKFKINEGLYVLNGYDKSISRLLIIDFKRSKGIAMEWMGLSVEKQIEYGWIKLK